MENERGSWISKKKEDKKKVECRVRWLDVVCLGVLMIRVKRGGIGDNDELMDWAMARAGVDEEEKKRRRCARRKGREGV